MVYFSKLKLYGFKSFVDKTEFEIGPGLNGIVGPNGCGKSNLVEALRWVMGEKSAKNMRGGGMEDVIFAGTSKRPARNMAEVTVVMNNEDGSAPAPFNTATELEINRRIERDKGSQYRVNGKSVRARDVNLLFADTMTGANSPALVSQGRITEIITAKPADRRKILEESAGISGLHTRRHEAELRLRAAEQNLTRLDDTLRDMRSRLSSLKRQAKQAERYKEYSDTIRQLEMALSWSEWKDIHSKIREERAQFDTHNTDVQNALTDIKQSEERVTKIETDLPAMRQNHMKAQAKLQSAKITLDRLEDDLATRAKGLKEALDAKETITSDIAFTTNQSEKVTADLEQATQTLSQLNQDTDTLPNKITVTQEALHSYQEKHTDLTNQKQAIETEIAVAKQAASTLDDRIQSAQNTKDKLQQNIDILRQSIDENDGKLKTLQSDDVFTFDLDAANTEYEAISAIIETLKADSAKIEQTLLEGKSKLQDTSTQIHALEGELNAINALLSRDNDTDSTLPQGDDALLNHLQVKSGFEHIVTTAVGQWIDMAGLDDSASVYWDGKPVNVSAPNGTTPLIDYCEKFPSSLTSLLTAVGVCDVLDINIALLPGQMVIAKDGSFKRWDGLIAKTEAQSNHSSQASLILEQKNRAKTIEASLTNLRKDETTQNQTMTDLETQRDTLKTDLANKQNTAQDLSNTIQQNKYDRERLTDQITSLNERLVDQKNRLKTNDEELASITHQLSSLTDQKMASDGSVIAEKMDAIDVIQKDIESLTVTINDHRTDIAKLNQEKFTREQTITSLNRQIERNTAEKEEFSQRLAQLNTRLVDITTKIEGLESVQNNQDDTQQRETLLNTINQNEKDLSRLTDQLAEQETLYKTAQNDLREAESKAASAREKRATSQANVANGEEELKRIKESIADHFSLSPQHLEEQVYSLFDNDIPDTGDLFLQKETVTRQRDGIGPVNLRAAIESEETETQLLELETEYTDLTKAIEQLRGGISKLNKEAKERLAIAFARVDQHFQRLFEQLFEGGKAYLEMIQSDDPLEAGLEIYAQPPGKSLQKLSLLSGGEQTLTATALIFAMFLTNPSPICVLDEIDAPLDDANVDRICTLMEHIANDTHTRFIVITHHRMTMARMDRLYGVTMGERGVSQLVSVDMALQEELALAETAA